MQLKLLTALIAAGLAAAAAHAQVTDKMIQSEATAKGNVLTWGINTQGQRYSPLKQVNSGNASRLLPVWAFSFGGEKQRGQESQPVIMNGKMFVTASYSRIYALDAATGKKLWKYKHRLPEGIMPCCDVVNRGAALFDNLVIFATLDAQLVALDQNTGDVVWKEKIDDYASGYSATAAPIIADGVMLTGVSGGEFGVVGRVEARDPKTGKMAWEVKNGAPLWGGVLTTGGNLVFWGTPEGYLKAADAKTGKVVWVFKIPRGGRRIAHGTVRRRGQACFQLRRDGRERHQRRQGPRPDAQGLCRPGDGAAEGWCMAWAPKPGAA